MLPEVERFRVVRQNTIAVLDELTDEQAMWIPRRGSWSIAQISDHLLTTEEMYRSQFARLLEHGDNIEISLKEVSVAFAAIPHEVIPFFELPFRVFNQFVPHALRETMVRYPMIASLNPQQSQPREHLDRAKLSQDLAAAIAATEEFFRTPLPPGVERLTINHPILGNNTIPQLLRIMVAHEQRHHEQMSRVRGSAGFPRNSL